MDINLNIILVIFMFGIHPFLSFLSTKFWIENVLYASIGNQIAHQHLFLFKNMIKKFSKASF